MLAGLGLPSTDVVVTVGDRWSDLVGAEVAPHVTPVAIEHGRLTVVAETPAWASHLRWAEAEMLSRLTELIGAGVVTSVVVRVARS